MTVPFPRAALPLGAARALLFDLDGVLTPTAEVHMRAWSRLFTAVLADYPAAEPYTDADYFLHVDGKPRYDGVRDLLASRGISLPDGQPSDPVTADTVCGLGNRKNEAFNAELAERGVTPFPGSVAFLDAAAQLGVDPEHAVVLEDAHSGVAAGRDGGFGLVIGIARGADAEVLSAAGAHVVVPDLADLVGSLPPSTTEDHA